VGIAAEKAAPRRAGREVDVVGSGTSGIGPIGVEVNRAFIAFEAWAKLVVSGRVDARRVRSASSAISARRGNTLPMEDGFRDSSRDSSREPRCRSRHLCVPGGQRVRAD
jgi:hypothetical protein